MAAFILGVGFGIALTVAFGIYALIETGVWTQ